jgi:hypothetical protein
MMAFDKMSMDEMARSKINDLTGQNLLSWIHVIKGTYFQHFWR